MIGGILAKLHLAANWLAKQKAEIGGKRPK